VELQAMRAIIPVAGGGTRLRPHTFTLPKVLINVAGKPMLGHILDKVMAEGVTEATLVVGDMSEMIREFVASAYPDFRVDYVEQEERMGLGHAIYLCRDTLSGGPLLIIYGDTIFDVDLKPVLRGGDSSIGVKEVDDPRRFGVAVLEDGYVTRLVEKPETPISNLAIVGINHIVHPDLLVDALSELVEKDIRTKGEYQLTDALQIMIQRGERMTTFPVEGWYDCGTPETLLEANRVLLGKRSAHPVVDGVLIKDPVYISPSARLTDCVIGPNTTVGDNALVSESVIRNSIVSENAVVEQALLENSIVGNGATVKGSYKRVNVGNSSEVEFY
ncbi:MAG: sugar phosphate nucleotidyltransferase, partial [Bacteroidota bacterium]